MGVKDMPIQSFKIGHHDYALKYEDVLKAPDGDLLDGQCNKHGKIIKMSNDFENKDFQTSVLLHEIIHGVIFESGYAFESFADEEEFTYLFGKTLHGFMKDNIDVLNKMYRPKDAEDDILDRAVERAGQGFQSTVADEMKKQIESLKAEVSE